MRKRILPLSFYTRSDVLALSRECLGKHLVTSINGKITSGRIVETEAYAGTTDKASHAYGNRRTSRTDPMFMAGGIAYVYLCYGIHHLFNIVTNIGGIPHAILVRGLEPQDGLRTMADRRGLPEDSPRLTNGPGSLAQALGITSDMSGTSLVGNSIWLEDHGARVGEEDVLCSPRVGVDYAGKDAALPWRFRVKGNPWTSPAK